MILKEELKIGSIGGGPGNDCLALALFYRNHLKYSKNIKCEILDYSFDAWEKANFEIMNNTYSKEKINFDWKFCDFKENKGSFSSKF